MEVETAGVIENISKGKLRECLNYGVMVEVYIPASCCSLNFDFTKDIQKGRLGEGLTQRGSHSCPLTVCM